MVALPEHIFIQSPVKPYDIQHFILPTTAQQFTNLWAWNKKITIVPESLQEYNASQWKGGKFDTRYLKNPWTTKFARVIASWISTGVQNFIATWSSLFVPHTCENAHQVTRLVVLRFFRCPIAQLSNPRRRYCDFNIFWPNDLEHLSHVAGIIFTKPELRQPTSSWLLACFLLLIRHVTPRPWLLSPWPWTIMVHWRLSDPSLY